jgi:gliding motility-associated-like protein
VKKDITYYAQVKNSYGCTTTDSINIRTFCKGSQVFIPNAFTPDGDGLNDILMVRGKGIALVKSFRVFSRWGELVFEKKNFLPNDPAFGWDGKIKGVTGASEVYVFTAEVACDNDFIYIYKGNTTLLK